jgi:hypothetical protein
MYMASRFRALGAICRAFGRGYTFANRGNRFTWSESFTFGTCKSLCSNSNHWRSFRR